MRSIAYLAAGGLLALALGACTPKAGGAPGDTGQGADGGYNSAGTKGVTQDQADWISRTHARPAGR